MPVKGIMFPALCVGNEVKINHTVFTGTDGRIREISPLQIETEGVCYLDGTALVMDGKAEPYRTLIIETLGQKAKGLPPYEAAARIIGEELYGRYKTESLEDSVLIVIDCCG